MSEATSDGYVCIPYMHDHQSVEIKDSWQEAKNIENMYFATATFSEGSKQYFPTYANHYLIAKFKDGVKIKKELEINHQQKTSFVFNTIADLFERDIDKMMNFVSVYYLEYLKSDEDLSELATTVSKNDLVSKATTGNMESFSSEPSKFEFPYKNNIVVLEVSSQKSHQSVNKHCEQTRRNVCRKGLTMNNLVGLSILEKLK